jgi:hypothetical protein
MLLPPLLGHLVYGEAESGRSRIAPAVATWHPRTSLVAVRIRIRSASADCWVLSTRFLPDEK